MARRHEFSWRHVGCDCGHGVVCPVSQQAFLAGGGFCRALCPHRPGGGAGGSSLIGREEDDGTLESLLANPVSRSSLLGAKAISGLIILAAVTLVGLSTTLVLAKMVGLAIPFGNILIVTLACFGLVLATGTISYFIAATGRGRAFRISVPAFLALGGYIIASLAGTVDWLKVPSKFLPFHYYQSEAILKGNTNWSFIAVPFGVSLIFTVLAFIAFRRRDLG